MTYGSRRLFRLALALALGLSAAGLGTSSTALAQAPPHAPAAPVIGPARPEPGQKVTATGKLTPASSRVARPVLLQRRKGARWVRVDRARTTARGAYTLSTRAPTKAGPVTYRVSAPAVTVKIRGTRKRLPALVSRRRSIVVVPPVVPSPPPPAPEPALLELGPSAQAQVGPAHLSDDGSVLLHNDNCADLLTSRRQATTTSVGNDSCTVDDLTADGEHVFYPSPTRSDDVPPRQSACTDSLSYMYRWGPADEVTWIDLDGECTLPVFEVSDSGEMLAAFQGGVTGRIVLHDLQAGQATTIARDCYQCAPVRVSDDGSSVVYIGSVPLVDRTGEVHPDQTERALFVWHRGAGSTLIAGGTSGSRSVDGVAASADASAVAFVITADTTVSQPEESLYRWTATGGTRKVATRGRYSVLSMSADGDLLAVSYTSAEAGGRDTVALVRGDDAEVTKISDLGIEGDAQYGTLGGDGTTLAFETEEALLPDDVDSSTAGTDDDDWYYLNLAKVSWP